MFLAVNRRSLAIRRLHFASLALCASLAAPLASAQAPVTLDFESFPGPDGRFGTADDIATPPCPGGVCAPVTSGFATAGIVFTSGTLGSGALFPGHPATNHYITSAPPDVALGFPAYGVTLASFSFWTATLYALDAGGNVIATNTLVNPAAGTAFFQGTLSVSTTLPIRRFVVLAAGCTVGGPSCSQILNLDDFVIVTAPPAIAAPAVPVPALSEWAAIVLSIALAGAAGVSMRRRSSARPRPRSCRRPS
jgi:hypothetical protein